MTDITTPATVGTPTFRQWFLSSYGLRAYPIALILIACVLYAGATVVVATAGTSLPASTIFVAALDLVVVGLAVAKLRRGYRRATAPVRAVSDTAEGGAVRATSSSGDSPVVPMIIPGTGYFNDQPSHGGHSGKGHSDGGHSSHGGYDGGGYSGGSDSGGSSGGDGGGGGGD